jgi:Leucine-rich repeat (LRR) protein
MTKNLVALFLIIILCHNYSAQSSKVYLLKDLSDTISIDSVIHISFVKEKLDSLPTILKRFNKVQTLDLSKNNIKSIPIWIEELKDLHQINLDKNKLDKFPIELLKLNQLDSLQLSRNKLTELPDNINALKNLTYIDLWDNQIIYFPESLNELKNLKILDIRGVTYGPTFIENLETSLNWVKILFDEPCTCVE